MIKLPLWEYINKLENYISKRLNLQYMLKVETVAKSC